MRVILGSASPRRKVILSSLITDFEIIIPEIDESAAEGETPIDYAVRIAELKGRRALELAGNKNSDIMIISCDTIVALDNKIFGKPDNYPAAVEMLSSLQGKTHEVISGLSIKAIRSGKTLSSARPEKTAVKFKSCTDDVINHYLSSIDYMDKAGSYAFQHNGSMIIESWSGSATNIIGFPLRLFYTMTSEMNLMAIF